ncbi:MAG TPA: DinB family protein [Vicinamibacteria bacterium]|jgi:uncharacterized damage-inducible protein DinB
MDARVVALADILRLNTRLFRNCLDGFTDEMAGARPSATTNSAAFVAAHVTDSRFFLLRVIGSEEKSPLAPYLDRVRTIDELKQAPPLAEIQSAWTSAAHALRERLDGLTAAALDGPAAARFPVAGQSMLAALTFLVQHDSYHVGQLALLRRHAGLPAMSYS